MLNSDRSPVKPAAIAAIIVRCSPLSWANFSSGWPINEPPKISCSIGDAMPITPMPALTFKVSTSQISQNCRVLCASLRCTLCAVIIAFLP